MERRRFLAALPAALGVTGGCAALSDGAPPGPRAATDAATTSPGTDRTTTTPATDTARVTTRETGTAHSQPVDPASSTARNDPADPPPDCRTSRADQPADLVVALALANDTGAEWTVSLAVTHAGRPACALRSPACEVAVEPVVSFEDTLTLAAGERRDLDVVAGWSAAVDQVAVTAESDAGSARYRAIEPARAPDRVVVNYDDVLRPADPALQVGVTATPDGVRIRPPVGQDHGGR